MSSFISDKLANIYSKKLGEDLSHPVPYEISEVAHNNEDLIRTAIVREKARALIVTFLLPPTIVNETSRLRNATVWVRVKVDENLLGTKDSGGSNWSDTEEETTKERAHPTGPSQPTQRQQKPHRDLDLPLDRLDTVTLIEQLTEIEAEVQLEQNSSDKEEQEQKGDRQEQEQEQELEPKQIRGGKQAKEQEPKQIQEETQVPEVEPLDYIEVSPGEYELRFFISHGYTEEEVFGKKVVEEAIPIPRRKNEGGVEDGNTQDSVIFHEFSCGVVFHVDCRGARMTCSKDNGEDETVLCRNMTVFRRKAKKDTKAVLNNTSTDTQSMGPNNSNAKATDTSMINAASIGNNLTKVEEAELLDIDELVYLCVGEDDEVRNITCANAHFSCEFSINTCLSPVMDKVRAVEAAPEVTEPTAEDVCKDESSCTTSANENADADEVVTDMTVRVCPAHLYATISCVSSSSSFASLGPSLPSTLLLHCFSTSSSSSGSANSTLEEAPPVRDSTPNPSANLSSLSLSVSLPPISSPPGYPASPTFSSYRQTFPETETDTKSTLEPELSAITWNLKIECSNASSILAPPPINTTRDKSLLVDENIDYYGESLKHTNRLLNKAFGYEGMHISINSVFLFKSNLSQRDTFLRIWPTSWIRKL